MKIETEVISRETIKPSSPTPPHLQHYQLSFLDQTTPQIYLPIILFFKSNSNISPTNAEKFLRLKTSLSKTLTRFYPLAGQLVGKAYVDCNDEGVIFVQAHIKSQLSQVTQNANLNHDFNKLLPLELGDHRDNILLAIQVNFFDCGGLAISVCTSHVLADLLSVTTFVTSWAAASHGNKEIICPSYESSKLFQKPCKDISSSSPLINHWVSRSKTLVTKMFVFENSMINSLRTKYSDYSTNKDYPIKPSRFEALSSFIWTRYVAALKADHSGIERQYAMFFGVNLRTIMDPPLPACSYGNLLSVAMLMPSMNSGGDFHGLARQMRVAIKNVDRYHVKKLQEDGDECFNFIRDFVGKSIKKDAVSLWFTSLLGMPIHAFDFGWGKVARTTTAGCPITNIVQFLDTKEGDGVEAWINLEAETMAKLELDEEFLSYVSQPTPGGMSLLSSKQSQSHSRI